MRNILLLVSMLAQFSAFSQKADSIPPFKQVPVIPQFKLRLADSSWYSKADLSSKKFTWIIYFSPDCSHCQLETEEIISNISKLKNVQVLMITSRPFQDMKEFSEHYLLNRFSNIKVANDPARFFIHFYNVETTPFSAIYNKKGNLVKAYYKGAKMTEVIKLAK